MGREHDRVPAYVTSQGVEAAQHEHVGIEQDRAMQPSIQEMAQQVGLGRDRDLLAIVVKAEAREVRDPEVSQPNERKRLARGVEVAVYLVGQKRVEGNVRMVTTKRLTEHPREGQVVLRDDGGHGPGAERSGGGTRCRQ